MLDIDTLLRLSEVEKRLDAIEECIRKPKLKKQRHKEVIDERNKWQRRYRETLHRLRLYAKRSGCIGLHEMNCIIDQVALDEKEK